MTDRTAWSQCSIELPDGGRCRDTGVKDAPFPICSRHLREAFTYCYAQLTEVPDTKASALLRQQAERDKTWAMWTDRIARGKPRSVVYYMKIGDRIKIGTTVNITTRKSAYPPGSELLATELGSYALESQRHAQFARYLVAGREWFIPSAPLMAHISTLQAQAA